MDPLPLLPSCSLDAAGLRAQRERYRQIGRSAAVERHAERIVVALDRPADGAVVEELIAVERACCPFFAIDWDPDRAVLSISVSAAEHAPALDAIEFALAGAVG